MAIWDDLITDQDRKSYNKYRSRTIGGFGKKPALLIVDMTYAFTDDRFSTGYSLTGEPCVRGVKRLLECARNAGVPVIYTRGKDANCLALAGLWKSGTTKETRRADEGNVSLDTLPEANEIVQDLQPLQSECVMEKHRPSAFFGTLLPSVLTFHGVDTVIVTGMSTSGCVRATVVDAFSYNYKVIVPLEAVADRSETGHKANLFDIHMKYGDVLGIDEVVEYLKAFTVN